MPHTLVIAEKPSAAREIAAALNVTKKFEGWIESHDYIVTWAAGHLATLKEPDEYKDEWKKWSFETLPMLPEKYELKVIDSGKKQFNIIKKFLISKDISKVVNACDAGREGELIFDNIYRLSGSKIPAFRLWTSAALTPEAIKREFLNLKPIEEFHGLRLAARARATADWTIGMNATRAVTLAAQKNGKRDVFSVGRVQTPTLQFLVEREKEIQRFQSKPFWTIIAQCKTQKNEIFLSNYEHKIENTFTNHILNSNEAKKIVQDCQNKNAKIVKVDSKENRLPPPLLFDLTELQKECNKRFALTANKTLEIAQSLYEKHKCISYPRTEYRHLTEDNRKTIPTILKSLSESFEKKFLENALQNYSKPNKRIFDNSKVGDHHALIPTTVLPKNLSDLESKIYEMIVLRFLCVFSSDFEFYTSILASFCENHLFVARGKQIKSLGWKQIEKNLDENFKTDDEQKLPNLNVGDFVVLENLKLRENKTKPPPRYNDSSLLSAMQNPASKTEDKEEKDLLRSCGLGTPATRASIIKRLEDTKYIERDKKNIKPTIKAFDLMEMLVKYNQKFLSNPVMTAEWEKNLQEIEKDPKKSLLFLEKLNFVTKEIVGNIKKDFING